MPRYRIVLRDRTRTYLQKEGVPCLVEVLPEGDRPYSDHQWLLDMRRDARNEDWYGPPVYAATHQVLGQIFGDCL